MKRALLSTLAIAAASAPAIVAQPAEAAVVCTSRGSSIHSGEFLNPGDCLKSSGGGYFLKMQTDGNLVLVRADASVCWAANWEIGNTFVRGDRMFFRSTSRGAGKYLNEVVVSDRFPTTDKPVARYRARYQEYKLHTDTSQFSASLNNKGEFWIGFDRHHWC